jgi:integrase
VAQKLLEVRQQQTTGQYVQPDKMTVGKWLDTWLETYVKPPVGRNRGLLRQQHKEPLETKAGPRGASKLRPENVQAMLNEVQKQGLKPATVTKAKNVLKAAMKQAIINRLILHDPCEGPTRRRWSRKKSNTCRWRNNAGLWPPSPKPPMAGIGVHSRTGLRIAELCGSAGAM